MKKYAWRNSVTSIVSNIRGKLAVKTENTNWLQTKESVVVLVSIESKFHSEISGDLKMDALMSTIKSQVQGKITILLTEGAHLSCRSLVGFGGDKQKTEAYLHSLAIDLHDRYIRHFSGCNVMFWNGYIIEDASYDFYKAFIKKLHDEDPVFKELLFKDIEEPSDEAIFDLLEMCICQLVLSSKGYRYLFYPGQPNGATEYVNGLLAPEKRIDWVNVFLSIEKKQMIVQSS